MHFIYFHCSAISAATGNFYYVGIYHSFGFYWCIVLCGMTIAYCDYRRGMGNAGGRGGGGLSAAVMDRVCGAGSGFRVG